MRYKELQQLIHEEINRLELPQRPADLYDPIRYTLGLGGKRMRPVLCLLGAELFGGDAGNALRPALGIEVFHNFTLLHDDIMDEAPIRRGRESVFKKWNPNVAILSGDVMFVKSCELMMQCPDPVLRNVLDTFYSTAVEVCEGQQLDMDFEERDDVSVDEYLQMIRLKTAVLLGCSLKIGSMIAGASEEDSARIYKFGVNVGIAFQLQDDILDTYGDGDKVGKKIGGDIRSNKKTMLLIKAKEVLQGNDREKLDQCLAMSGDEERKVEAVIDLYNKAEVLESARKEMDRFYSLGLENLDAIDANLPTKEALRGLTDMLMVRES